MPHFMIILILYINLLNLSWIKMSIFEEYGAFLSLSMGRLESSGNHLSVSWWVVQSDYLD